MIWALIRPAGLLDISNLLDMGEKFAARADLNAHVGYNSDDMAKTFRAMIEGDEFCLFIGESGTLGGMIAPHPFNHSQLFVDELFWWAEGGEGVALLKAFEDWAAERGALVRMTALEAVQPERVGKLLERRGYVPLERAFIKVN